MATTTMTNSATAATTNYTLSLNDMSAWANILGMQTQMRLSATANNDDCWSFAWWVSHFTMYKRYDWEGGGWGVNNNTPVYSIISNTDLRQWMTDMFVQLGQLQVPAYNVHYYEIYIALLRTYLLTSAGNVNSENVGGWTDLIMAAKAKWKNGLPPASYDMEIQKQNEAATWSNAAGLQSAISVLWTDQSNALKKLSQLKELTNDQCLYLLYLLLSLATGTADHQKSVQKIVSAPCNSMELPNSNFCTSLVYYNMMLLADPLGGYTQTNPQIQGIINGLSSMVTGTDPGAVAMKAALSTQAKILLVSANYPMVDPYNPAIGFTTRQSDMLDAINTTWAQLQTS